MNENPTSQRTTRVVITLRPGTASNLAIKQAVHMARAFDGDLHGLFINDENIEQAGELPVARSLSASGHRLAHKTAKDLKREIFLSSQAMRRQFDQLAIKADLRHHFQAVREQPLSAMLGACAAYAEGRNLLVLSETLALRHISEIRKLLEKAENLTGILMVGPGAAQRSGPVIIVPENLDHAESLIQTAEILGRFDQPIIIFLTGENETVLRERADHLHSGLEPSERVKILTAHFPGADPAAVIEAIRRLKGGLVVAEHGGALVPCQENIAALATALECPLLITKQK